MYQSSTEGYVIVPINKIIIDKAIINTVKKYGSKVPKGILVSKAFSSPLNRMEPLTDNLGNIFINSPHRAIQNGISLPPIILNPYGDTGYYTINGGRHRVASSIIKGYNYIPAYIIQ